ncbi:hypothetical protein [Mucilaginibacter flavidus]|uniref:hypothetical protein n=1 Tax=Mucilaginibacter flavidus TaxID=2949309 RepID=UPI002091F85D|nr:hypothetical protein [Mucilaginibacter flavidus]MCO5945402.1 hypothetical protein [Mucilaginibacter flavidus]
MESNNKHLTPRRGFIGTLAAGAAALGMAAVLPLGLNAETAAPPANKSTGDLTPDEWFSKLKGSHRIVYDATHPEGMMPFAWPRVFLITNSKTGTPASDCGVVVVLRHNAIPFAFDSSIWKKYNLGTAFKIDDPTTNATAQRNPYWQPAKGDFKIPGIGEVEIGINQLQADGVMFCVCDVAVTVMTAVMAQKMNLDPAEVKSEWLRALLPGVMVAPSGVWAVGRAQEHKCSYCFVG